MSVEMVDEFDAHTDYARYLRLMEQFAEQFRRIMNTADGILATAYADPRRSTPLRSPDVARRNNLKEQFAKLRSPAEELARFVSGEIEEGRAERLEAIELRLRLAELEGALFSTERLLGELDKV